MTPDRLLKLTAEIDAFGRATISRADLAAFNAMRAGLVAARAFVDDNLKGTLACVCFVDPATGEPDESTIDVYDAKDVARIRGVLVRIDAALESKP